MEALLAGPSPYNKKEPVPAACSEWPGTAFLCAKGVSCRIPR